MNIKIKIQKREIVIPSGRPVIVQWKSKNKQRPGISTGIGWLKPGENPATVELVHSCFETWDKIEREYPAHWTIFKGQILDVRPLMTVR